MGRGAEDQVKLGVRQPLLLSSPFRTFEFRMRMSFRLLPFLGPFIIKRFRFRPWGKDWETP